MSKQLLIYETAVPLSAARHRDYSVETGASYTFSDAVNAVPLMAVEFPPAASEYAIVFAGTDKDIMPAVILGMRSQNLYLAKEGAWDAKYIPAFVRRYPFVFSETTKASDSRCASTRPFPELIGKVAESGCLPTTASQRRMSNVCLTSCRSTRRSSGGRKSSAKKSKNLTCLSQCRRKLI